MLSDRCSRAFKRPWIIYKPNSTAAVGSWRSRGTAQKRPIKRHGRTISSAPAARNHTVHGPLQRLLGGIDTSQGNKQRQAFSSSIIPRNCGACSASRWARSHSSAQTSSRLTYWVDKPPGANVARNKLNWPLDVTSVMSSNSASRRTPSLACTTFHAESTTIAGAGSCVDSRWESASRTGIIS